MTVCLPRKEDTSNSWGGSQKALLAYLFLSIHIFRVVSISAIAYMALIRIVCDLFIVNLSS